MPTNQIWGAGRKGFLTLLIASQASHPLFPTSDSSSQSINVAKMLKIKLSLS
jgi:hypothetical protein